MNDPTAPRSNGLLSVACRGTTMLEHWLWIDGAEPQTVHAHDAWQICEYLNEPGHYTCRGSREAVPARAFTLVAPGDAHAPSDAEVRLGARYRVWYFEGDALTAIARDARHRVSRLPVVWNDPSVLASLQAIALDFAADEVDVRIEALLARLLGIEPSDWQHAQAARASHRSLDRAHEYLWSQRHRLVPLGELASVAELSVSRLAHGFRHRFHVTPSALGLAIRTDHGRHLLATGMTPAEAASEAGFADQAHFTRCFRRLVGPTPASYRKLILGTAAHRAKLAPVAGP